MENNTPKIRVYCPEHQRGFEIEPSGGIYCETGNHYLASEFPPKKAYLEYCCGCQRFIPFSIIGKDKKAECLSCEKKIGRRYFCHKCQTLTNDVEKKGNDKKFRISAEGEIFPNCPACSVNTNQNVPQIHACEVLKTIFFTLREVCEFCLISINPENIPSTEKLDKPKPETVDTSPDKKNDVLDKPDFLAVKEVATVQDLEEHEEEITIVISPKPISAHIEESQPTSEFQLESAEDNQIIQKKSSSALIGCLTVLGSILIVIVLCIGININKSTNDNTFNNSQSSNQSKNTRSNNSGENNTNTVNNLSVRSDPSFRSNSTIILDDAVLREDPEYNGYVIGSVEKGTNIRVIDRKSNKSPWYKVKTETGEEGWIQGDYIDSIDWSSLPCKIGEIGFISGGNLRLSPRHSVNEANILAVWNKGSKVKILDTEQGEPGAKSGNPYWFKVQVLEGTCSFDERKYNSTTESCKNETVGYMNSFLVSCD